MRQLCVLCGDPSARPPSDYSLPGSKSTVARFLGEHGIAEVDEGTGSFCSACITAVTNCDRWEAYLRDGVEKLRTVVQNRTASSEATTIAATETNVQVDVDVVEGRTKSVKSFVGLTEALKSISGVMSKRKRKSSVENTSTTSVPSKRRNFDVDALGIETGPSSANTGRPRTQNADPLMCPLCSVPVAHLQTPYTEHWRTAHRGKRYKPAVLIHPRVCSFCPFRTYSAGFYQLHMEKHGVSKLKYPCPQCDKKFTRSNYVKAHLHMVMKLRRINTNP